MPFDISAFRAKLSFDGARQSLFDVLLPLPPALQGQSAAFADQVAFKCRATSLPGDSVSSISVPYFGREIKIAGTRSFPQWSITVINDEDFMIRNYFEMWMDSINSHTQNIRTIGLNSFDYQVNATVRQFGKDGTIIKTYEMVGCFPTDVAAIDLDWASGDQIEEFGVTFEYQWWNSFSPTATTT